jgi:hypothetical protein
MNVEIDDCRVSGRIDRWFEQFRESKSSKAAKAVVEPLSEAPMDGGALVADPATARSV